MKFSRFVVPALMGTAFAVPAERPQVRNVLRVIECLYEKVKEITGAINGTTTNLSYGVADVPVPVVVEISDKIESITTLIESVLEQTDHLTNVNDSTVQSLVSYGVLKNVPAASGIVGTVSKRQTQVVSRAVTKLLLEIDGTLSNVERTIGLAAVFNVVAPLTGILSILLIDVDLLIAGTLVTVKSILATVLRLSHILGGVLRLAGSLFKNITEVVAKILKP